MSNYESKLAALLSWKYNCRDIWTPTLFFHIKSYFPR